MLTAAAQVQAYALAVIDQRSGEECEERRQSAESALDALEHAPKSARSALENHWRQVLAGQLVSDLAANEAALRLLCVRAELLSGRSTPPEDQELRREYQMKRLVAAMGQGERSGPGDLESLALEWLGVGPVESGLLDVLRQRFERCWTADGT